MLLAVWAEVGEVMRDQLQSFTLADMATGPGAAPGPGLTAPATPPGGGRPFLLDHRGSALVPSTLTDPRPGPAAAPHRRQPHPAGGQHPQDVAVGEAQGVAGGRPGPLDDPVDAAAHVGRQLAPGHPVGPQGPAGALARISSEVRPSYSP